MRVDNAQRARANVRRRLMALDARYLLTLTTRANVTDFETSRSQVQAFWRKMRRLYPDLHYCGCPERQKRGAWHWHFGIGQRLDAATVRAVWQTCCDDGNVDLQHRSALHVARYVAKYIGKDVGGERLPSTYMTSRGIPPPDITEIECDDIGQAFAALAESGQWSGEVFQLPEGRGFWAGSWR